MTIDNSIYQSLITNHCSLITEKKSAVTIRGALRMMGKLVKIGELPSFLAVTVAVLLVAVATVRVASAVVVAAWTVTVTVAAAGAVTTVATAVATRFLLLIAFRLRE